MPRTRWRRTCSRSISTGTSSSVVPHWWMTRPDGIEHAGLAVAAGVEAVDVEQVALEHGGTGLGHVQVDVAVDGVGHDRVQDHLGPHRGHGARGLGEPQVVAVEHREPADLGHVEHAELVARGDPLLERREGEHLAVAGDNRRHSGRLPAWCCRSARRGSRRASPAPAKGRTRAPWRAAIPRPGPGRRWARCRRGPNTHSSLNTAICTQG